MHNCAIWALLLEDHLALKCCRDELNQPCGSFGEQIRSDRMESFRYWFSGHSLRNVYFEATLHGLTRIEQMGTLRDGRDSPRGRTNREDHESQGSPTAGGASVANMKNCSIKSNLDNTAARLRRVGSSNWL